MPMHREMYRGIRFGKHLNVSLTRARDAGNVEDWRLGVFCVGGGGEVLRDARSG